MKTSIVTLQYGKRAYFDVSTEALTRYSIFHGYELVIAGGEAFQDNRDLRWSKVPAIMRALESSDLVLYLDADAMLVDLQRPISDILPLLGEKTVLVGEDLPGHANTGVLLCRAEGLNVLDYWHNVPEQQPETANTWPVDELAFNQFVLPAFPDDVSMPSKRLTSDANFLHGTFVQHYPNGNETTKAARVAKLVSAWK